MLRDFEAMGRPFYGILVTLESHGHAANLSPRACRRPRPVFHQFSIKSVVSGKHIRFEVRLCGRRRRGLGQQGLVITHN